MDDQRPFVPFRPFGAARGFSLVAVLLSTLLYLIVLSTTSPYSHGRLVLLPVARSAAPYLDHGDLPSISATSDGLILVNGRWHPAAELPEAISVAVRQSPDCSDCGIVLRADRSLPFGQLRRLIRLIAASGARDVILAVEPTPSTPLLPASNPGVQRTRFARR